MKKILQKMSDFLYRYRKDILGLGIVYFVLTCILVYYYRLWDFVWSAPLAGQTGGDGLFYVTMIKTMKESLWFFNAPRLGAPFGANFSDLFNNVLSGFDFLCVKILTLLTGHLEKAMNMEFFFTHYLTALTAYFALRQMRVSRRFSVPGALTYGLLYFIFVRRAHEPSFAPDFVPLTVLLCVWLAQDDFFIFNKSFFKSKKNIFAVIFLLLIASNGGGYFQYFSCFFVFLTGFSIFVKTKNINFLYKAIAMSGVVILVCLLVLLPSLIYLHVNHMSSSMARNGFSGYGNIEYYNLKFVPMLIPYNDHGFPLLRKMWAAYNAHALARTENQTAYLGIIGVFGFLISLFYPFVRKTDGSDKAHGLGTTLLILSGINFSAFALAIMGGFSSIIYFFFYMVRSYNRISVYIAFASIAVSCLLLDKFIQNRKCKPVRIIWTCIAICLFLIGIKDQIPPRSHLLQNKDAVASWFSEAEYFKEIENQLPVGAMVYQLPFAEFPEIGPIRNMGDYEHFRAYVHTKNLRWSYGMGKMDPRSKIIANMRGTSTLDLLRNISIAGFSGLYIDKRAYTDEEYKRLENEIIEITGVLPFNRGSFSFFNITGYASLLRAGYSKDQFNKLKNAVLSGTKFFPLNTQVDFYSNLMSSARDFFLSGISGPEAGFTWTEGKEAVFQAALETEADLKVTMSISSVLGQTQRVRIFAGSRLIEERTLSPADAGTILSFIVPKEYLPDGKILSLRFEYPDARTPQSLGINDDTRELAVAYSSMMISEAP